MAGAHGVDSLPVGYAITTADLEACEARAGVQVQAGDAVLVRTGWMRHWDQPARYNGEEGGYPGLGADAARWLVGRSIALTGADTTAYEVAPPRGESVHALLIVDAGLQILENLNLEVLAAAGIGEFLLIVLPLKLVGATASPVRPIAIV